MNRLYAQYQPDATSLRILLDIQRQATGTNSRARAVAANQLHLTIIHFGIIDEVFPQLQAVAPHLYYTIYKQAIVDFVRAVSRAMPPRLSGQLRDWELLGENGKTLVVGIQPSAELERVHQASLQALVRCFTTCGLSHPEQFMAANHNFQYALSLKPHITLLKNASELPRQPLEPKLLHLQAMPILYD